MRQLPVLCRTVLCAPPQGCRSLRVGGACCEWTCDRWHEDEVSDLGLRLVASAVTAILSLSLLSFLIYRLRQRRVRSRRNHREAESLSGGEEVALPHLKPDDLPPGHRPFPPSYDEAMQGAVGPAGEEEQEAPPYTSIQQDPVISYPVATLGRLVLPPAPHPSLALTRAPAPAPSLAHAGAQSPPPPPSLTLTCGQDPGPAPDYV